MSTNYYAVMDLCSCCGRHDTVHICKSLTSFRCPVNYEDDGRQVLGPASWDEWKARLRTRDDNQVDYIVDEYGRTHTVEEFITMVDDPTFPEQRRWQYDWCVAHDPGCVSAGPEPGKTWLDPDSGLTFTARSFS